MSINTASTEAFSNGASPMRYWEELTAMFAEKRVGFRFHEVMSGEHVFEPGFGPSGRHRMKYVVTWGPKHITRFVNPFNEDYGTADLEGTVTIGGLCEKAPCTGTFFVDYVKEHRIRYSFDFLVDGKPYHYVGEKVNIQPWNLPVSHTTCYGTLTESDTNRLVSRSVTYFRMRTAPRWITSFRFA